ncbi:hypothetical protein L1049_020309 [Liquidambar formosana]|uniref:Uncharacterized protein n=1 Tax=Liquidambar formosana TaxID=63359 RepID=A0AAP0X9R7_LIQFO
MRSFKQFVMRVLSFHRRPNIQKLNFSTPIFVEASLVKTMIRYAARRSVQELSIHARFNKCLEFARCLFSCKSLTALCLSGIFYENLDQVLGFPGIEIILS